MSQKFGKITQVIGAVVDVQFEDQLPEILTALECDNSGNRQWIVQKVSKEEIR